MTTLSRPELSAGSSLVTLSSGSGRKLAAGRGGTGALVSTIWKPAEGQVISARFGVSVGLCDEKLEKFSRSAGVDAHSLGSLDGSRYSLATRGAAGSLMSMKRTQPHGQPCAGSSPPSLP